MTTEPTLCNKPTIQELGTYRLVTVADFPDTISRLVQDGCPVSLDVEATGLDPWTNKLVCIQVGDGQLASICDVRHATEAEWERLADTIRLLFSGRVQLLGHNIRFDVLTLAVKAGIGPYELRHLRLYDTMLAEQVILGGVDAPDGKGRERETLQRPPPGTASRSPKTRVTTSSIWTSARSGTCLCQRSSLPIPLWTCWCCPHL